MTGTATAMKRQELKDAAHAWAMVETYRISITPVFDGELWFASADVLGTKHNKKRAIASVNVYGATGLDAVRGLLRKIEDGGIGKEKEHEFDTDKFAAE